MDLVAQLGVGGCFAILLIREFVSFAQRQDAKPSDVIEQVSQLTKAVGFIASQIRELYEWHDVTDPQTGMKSWYTSREQQQMIKTMLEREQQIVDLMQEMGREVKDLSAEIRRMNGKR